jgi:hypothetical protein
VVEHLVKVQEEVEDGLNKFHARFER